MMKPEVDKQGTKRWYNQRGQYYREDGPAIEWHNGVNEWRINDKLHRDNGPAKEYPSGNNEWHFKGKRFK